MAPPADLESPASIGQSEPAPDVVIIRVIVLIGRVGCPDPVGAVVDLRLVILVVR